MHLLENVCKKDMTESGSRGEIEINQEMMDTSSVEYQTTPMAPIVKTDAKNIDVIDIDLDDDESEIRELKTEVNMDGEDETDADTKIENYNDTNGEAGSGSTSTEGDYQTKDSTTGELSDDGTIGIKKLDIDPSLKTVSEDFDMGEKMKDILRKIGQKELEEIIFRKLVEVVNSHTPTAIGTLKSKCLQLHAMKDKLFQKLGVLQKQVTEMSKALKQYGENAAKSPAFQKPPPPLKFYRSVGLQVNIESVSKTFSGRPTPSSIRMTDSNANVTMKQIMNSPVASATPSPTTISGANYGTNGNGQSQGLKRINKPTITVAELRNQVGQPGPSKMARIVPAGNIPTPTRVSQNQPILPRNPAMSSGIANAVNNAAMAAAAQASKGTVGAPTSGLIDLTEDKASGGLIVNQNGVQYRVLNQSGIPPGMQIVSSPAGYHLVSPQGQTKQIVFQQANSNQSAGQMQAKSRQSSPNQNFSVRTPVASSAIRSNQYQQHQQRLSSLQASSRPSPNNVAVRVPTASSLSNGQHNMVTKIQQQYQQPSDSFTLPILPLPATPIITHPRKAVKDKPPQPELTLQEQDGGIVLSWTHKLGVNHAEISSYQIYACQQPLTAVAGKGQLSPAWKRVGDVKALPLPMACTLSQFSDENRYHFIVRGLDVYNRSGPFCEIVSIVLKKKK